MTYYCEFCKKEVKRTSLVHMYRKCYHRKCKYFILREKCKLIEGDIKEKRRIRREKFLRDSESSEYMPDPNGYRIRTQDTSIEIKIQDFVRLLGFKFFTQHYLYEIEHRYYCDIFIPLLNLVIECDGDYYHCYPYGTKIDEIHTQELIEKGFKVLRLWEKEINKMNITEFQKKIEVK